MGKVQQQEKSKKSFKPSPARKAESSSSREKRPFTKLSRKELIAQREKFKLMHKFKKEQRIERKFNPSSASTNQMAKRISSETAEQTTKNSTDRAENKRIKENPAVFTVYKRAQIEYEKKQEEKRKRKELFLKKKAEKDEALKEYKKKKKSNYHNLCKKSKTGQLLVSRQMDAILNKLNNDNNKNKNTK